MPFVVVPSREHPIYREWRLWRHRADLDSGFHYPTANRAKESIERIAEHAYPEHRCIVGFMIKLDDEQTEEEGKPEGSFDRQSETLDAIPGLPF